MCGLAGFLDFEPGRSGDEQAAVARAMASSLAHRGPDDEGIWTDPAAGVGLAHRRLSVVDLSPLGHQPMASESGRYVVVYNGEIYNFEELRAGLSGHAFRGRSDTEVMLAAFEEWGVAAALPRFNGMFAIALWDRRERTLWLARDRFGEKPLYFGVVGKSLVFASELKAIRRFPGFQGEIDPGSVSQLMRFAYVPSPRCIYRGLRKLGAGTFLRISSRPDVDREPTPYFSLEELARTAISHRFAGSEQEAADELDAQLRRAVKLRMIADVPLGAFLSGGIDSSVVVAMMQATGTGKAKTFTIGFNEDAYDESAAARAVAAHLGTDHTEHVVTSAEAQAVVPRLPELYDEPFADPSQIPTFLVSQTARRDVTVALSGDAGDELFGGYNRYVWADAVWRRVGPLPAGARSLAGALLGALRPSAIDRAFRVASPILPARLRQRIPGDKVQKLSEVVAARSADDLYFRLASTWKDPSAIVRGEEPTHPVLQKHPPIIDGFAERMMCADGLTYLTDDILVKVDRAAMGVSLETRVPLLDPDVARFAWSLPQSFKIREGKGKWLLREVLARYVPRPLFERPKMGFGVPIGDWLRGPLRGWAEDLLEERRLAQGGVFHPGPIRARWREHLDGRRNGQDQLWTVLMFQAWSASATRPLSEGFEPGRMRNL